MGITCLDCEHFAFRSAEPGYSEYTPGMDAELYCCRGVWQYDAYNETLASLRTKLYTARTCAKFTQDPEATQ